VAGPWFTVARLNEWETLGALQISDGKRDHRGKIEVSIGLRSNNAGKAKSERENVTILRNQS
jgi:hypothetical protein